jgi:beta-glucosidase-like glycosyl hydrolase/CubicO group peptidase (beta-lactamase class C family)
MKLTIFYFLLFLNILGFGYVGNAQEYEPDTPVSWADSVFQTLSEEEKIAQLFIIRAHSDKTAAYHNQVAYVVKEYQVGGVCFFQGGPERQAALAERYQKLSKVPLFVSQDAEWGLGMRLDSTVSFPRNMTLGALKQDDIIYEMGQEMAQQLKAVGVNMNFAPVVDVNSNPQNPVINSRSFGEIPEWVASKSSMLMYGLQDNGVIAVAKHFPGHGDTDKDSHLTLPEVNHSRRELNRVDLYPYKRLIEDGISGVMVAHLAVPSLEPDSNLPTTLSHRVVTRLLKDSMRFSGLVITDALEMQGITNGTPVGEIEVRALEAGNDMLLLPVNIHKAIKAIRKAVGAGRISQSLIDEKVKKILYYKQAYGLHLRETVSTDNLENTLQTQTSRRIIREVADKSITLLENQRHLLPLQRPDLLNLAVVSVGNAEDSVFIEDVRRYAPAMHFRVAKNAGKEVREQLLADLKPYDMVLLNIHETSSLPQQKFGIPESARQLTDSVAKYHPTVLSIFGIPYALNQFSDSLQVPGLLIAYEDRQAFHRAAAQLIFGGVSANGRLPVSISKRYPAGYGLTTRKTRLGYYDYAASGVKKKYIEKIDSIIIDGIEMKAFPGCQVVMAHQGKVFLERNYGYQTYQQQLPVTSATIYDLASITKIAATTLAVMRLSDEKRINIDRRLSNYLPYLRFSNKKDLIIRDVMAHQAGLQPWIPFYKSTFSEDTLDSTLYVSSFLPGYATRVAEGIYIDDDYFHQLLDSIVASPLQEVKKYQYSDLGFYLLYQAIENITNTSFDIYVRENFYEPLGLQTMGYHPRERFNINRIAPTEDDRIYRHQVIRGDVHDPGAAMMGGVSGHAGLFSNARDLAVLMQMMLNGGWYGETQYVKSSTLYQFTKTQFPLNSNRRGIGFDKPLINGEENSPVCEMASEHSFGHSGFTGTYAWADPDNQSVYVFLSNRVFPDADNWKIVKKDIRTKIHQVMYEALRDKK